MNLPPLTLRNKLLAFAALLVLIPGALIGVLAERSGRESLQLVIGAQLSREAHHTAHRLSTLLRVERETLERFARQDLMREIRVADIDKRISNALGTLREGSAFRVDYAVVDPGGRIVAASRASHIMAPPLWARPSANPLRAEREGLVLSAPIPDPDTRTATLGRLVGLLGWTLVGTLTEEVARDLAAQGIEAEVQLVRSDGTPLMGNVSERAAQRAEWARVLAGIGPDADYVVDTSLGSIVGRAALGSDLPEWKLVVAEPLSVALAPARRLRSRIAVMVALALAAALVVATVAARRVTRPLSDLTHAIEGLPRSDPSLLRVPVRTQDEVGSLAEAFNHMASELDRVQRNLVEAEKFAFVGELASGVAHEVRTSLGVLRSSAQILERSLPPDSGAEAVELAQMVRAEADRLAGVVNDLLRLDRPRGLHLEPTRVSEVVFRAADFVEAQAEEKRVRVHRNPLASEPTVLCDSDTIYQVAVNLMVNAVEALGEGGRVDIDILPARDGYGGFVIRDDGAGVPEALRDKIFQPFVTAKDSGVGLGLTFVKRVVHEHQGRIHLEPGVKRGACFRVELPTVEVES